MANPAAAEIHRSGLGLRQAVRPALARDHRHPLMDRLRGDSGGVRTGRVTLRLARAAGFCYGVERAVQYAYEAREAFPGRRIFLASPLIHNPQVHERLRKMGIGVLQTADGSAQTADRRPKTTGGTEQSADCRLQTAVCRVPRAACRLPPASSGVPSAVCPRPSAGGGLLPGDVVIIPAFGVTLDAMNRLRASGAVLVDTTCGSVLLVWKSVERLARDGFTVVMHGDPAHEETRATLSRVDAAGGRWVVVRDVDEAERLAAAIGSRIPSSRSIAPPSPVPPLAPSPFPFHASRGLHPVRDLQHLGLAHQTTMLSSESLKIADMLRDAVAARWGAALLPEHFRNFETICTATQERQDAVEALGREGVDLFLVVGGRDSHNTAHLADVAARFAPAYHIEGPDDFREGGGLRHWNKPSGPRSKVQGQVSVPQMTLDPGPWTTSGWFPPGPVVIGVAAGASTPDAVTGAVVERVIARVEGEHP
jgi:4-hydroxy-3-methylbut-2-enyl diphosphate reductase